MALSSLRCRPNAADALTRSETECGPYIYDGSVNDVHEREFPTDMRMSAALSALDEEGEPLQQNLAAAVNKITEGLRGDAFDMAMHMAEIHS